MRYITSIERLAKAEGREEGREEVLRQAVMSAILIRFDRVPDSVREAVHAIQDPDRLFSLHEVALRADSLETFQRRLPTD